MTPMQSEEEILLILSGVQILQDLEFEALKDIAQRIRFQSFSEGETLIRRGEQGDRLYIVFDGRVEVRVPNIVSGSDRCIQLGKGAVLGEISMLTHQPYSAEVIALRDTGTFYLDRTQFNELVAQYASFAENMTQLMGERLAHDEEFSRVGHYSLQRKLGEGNTSIVFDAFDPTLNRHVAVKMLKYELSHNKAFIKRFEREARTIASLSHPNILQVHAIIDEYSTRFMVMEKLHGWDLDYIIKEKGPLSVAHTRGVLYQVATALAYAHTYGEQGVIHRDIKPSNIFIDEGGNVKLTDFGVSCPPLRDMHYIVGTPLYLAPEIIKMETVDGRADIYALGVTAFYMLTGRHPFVATTVEKVLKRHLNDAPPDVRSIRPDIDDDMADFIQRAMEKDPEKRISNWNMIRVLLKPGSKRDEAVNEGDEICFEVKLRHTSYSKLAPVINELKQHLEESGIEHHIKFRRPGNG